MHDSSMIGSTLHIHESLGISLIKSLGAPQNMFILWVIMRWDMWAFTSIKKFLILRILLLHFYNFIVLTHCMEISRHGFIVSVDTFCTIVFGKVLFQVAQKSILDMFTLLVIIKLILILVNSFSNRWRNEFDSLGSLPKKSNTFGVISLHRFNLWRSPGFIMILSAISCFSTTSHARNWT